MATVAAAVASNATTTALSVYPSSSFTPVAGDLLIMFGSISGTAAAGTGTASANGITFTQIDRAPFGGGAHMCLGLHFAYMQVKVLMAQILTRYRIEIAPGYEPKWQPWPIPKPRDGLTVTFTPV